MKMGDSPQAAALWPKGTRSHGHLVPAEVLNRAWSRWDPAKGYASLAHLIRLEHQQPDLDRTVEHDRIADRMLQKARNAGLIWHRGGGVWSADSEFSR